MSSAGPITPEALRSYRYCEQLARRAAANFYHAFRILRTPQRRAMCALYAFARVADDLADDPGSVIDKQAALNVWRQQLHSALAGTYHHPLHAALHDTVLRYKVPTKYLDALLDGVCLDLTFTRYATFAELYLYCYRVASVVGLCCIRIWGCELVEAEPLAEAAGIAFQLTNIVRDVAEDGSRDRIYLPADDRQRFGVPDDDLRAGRLSEPVVRLLAFEVERAREYYRRAEGLVDYLPVPGRSVFLVMLRTYRGLLDAIQQRGYDVFSQRVRLSRCRKLWLVAQVLPSCWRW